MIVKYMPLIDDNTSISLVLIILECFMCERENFDHECLIGLTQWRDNSIQA